MLIVDTAQYTIILKYSKDASNAVDTLRFFERDVNFSLFDSDLSASGSFTFLQQLILASCKAFPFFPES
jgi:hypothetical protein